MGSLSSKTVLEESVVEQTTAAAPVPQSDSRSGARNASTLAPPAFSSSPPCNLDALVQQQQQVLLDPFGIQQSAQIPNQSQPRRSSRGQATWMNQLGAQSRSQCADPSFSAQNFNDDDIIEVVQAAIVAQPEPDPVIGLDAALALSTRIEYSAIPRGQTQDVFGLLTVQAVKPSVSDPSALTQSSERQPMDLVCVLDVSGSMKGDKIQQVKDATRFILEQSTSKDRVSIVTFNSSAVRVLKLSRMDPQGKDSANVATLRLQASGGTSIASGLNMALSVMEQRRQRNKVSSILLLTDGQDGSTRQQLPSLLTRARQANCSVYSFGFGRDHDASLLSDLAEQAQTPFTFVEDTEMIREAFAGAVGGLCSIVAQSVELTITSHVPLKEVHTPFTTVRSSDTSAVVTIPDMFAGERRDILVELAVPAGGDAGGQTKLLEAHVRFTDLRSGSVVQTPTVVMEAVRVEEPQPEAEPDQEVSAQRERIEITRALQQAADQSDNGRFAEAQQVLDMAGERMKSKRTKTAMSDALCEELSDARSRMRSSSMWEGGGRAEVHDATQMHKMQRCTNLMQSSTSAQKSSKQMYCNAVQSSWISHSKQG